MTVPRSDFANPDLASPFAVAMTDMRRGAIALVEGALRRGDVALAFQPIMRAHGKGPAFYEGLVRVFDEAGRLIPARDFIMEVEATELGRRLDCAALAMGLAAIHEAPHLRLAVNMSARSIGYAPFHKILAAHIAAHPQDLERLILEITETSAMQMPELVTPFMRDLHAKGVSFALDDFGAGNTALRYLRDFSFDLLKVDAQFVAHVADDPDNQVLCSAIQSVACHFDMLIVAEGIENPADADWLSRAGFDGLQGYVYAVPSLEKPWLKETAPIHPSIAAPRRVRPGSR